MRKKPALAVLAVLLLFSSSFAFHPHELDLSFSLAIPGSDEVTKYFAPDAVSFDESIKVIDLGVEYNFRVIRFLSLGLGLGYLIKPAYTQSLPAPETHKFTFNALEPYFVIKGFIPINYTIDILIGAGAGYVSLAGSSLVITDSGGSSQYDLEGSGVSFKFLTGAKFTSGNIATTVELGYKAAAVSGYTAKGLATTRTMDTNMGGLFFGVKTGLAFGKETEEDTAGKLTPTEKDVEEAEIEGAGVEKAVEEIKEEEVEEDTKEEKK